MARLYIYRCDGCDAEKTTSTDYVPSHWAELRIAIEGYTNWRAGGGKNQILHRLLCGTCQITLAERTNPTAWQRALKVDRGASDVS